MKKAVLVGINYRGQRHELRGCVNDMTNVRNYLLSRGYLQQNIKLMTDDTAETPTQKNILSAIEWLCAGAKAGDTLLFYYSGHGFQVADASNDEAGNMDDVIMPIDCDTAPAITDDEFRAKLVNAIPAGACLWAFFDCCHSGTMFDLKYNVTSEAVPKIKTRRDELPKAYVDAEWSDAFKMDIQKDKTTNGSVVMFSGCLDAQTSADAVIQGQSQGAFTFCLLECLNKKPPPPKGRTIKDVLKEVSCTLQIMRYRQRSQLSIGKIEDMNLPFNI